MGLASLRAKLTASFAALAAVFASLAMYFFPNTALRYAEQLERERAQSLARTLAKATTSALDFGDDLAMRDLVDSIADEPEGRFSAVFGSDGKEVVTFTANTKEKVDFARYGKMFKDGRLIDEQTDLLVVAHPVKGSIGKGGYFMIGLSRETITIMRERVRTVTFTFALLIVGAASALGWSIGRVIAKPATGLADTSRRMIDSGDLTLDFDASTRDEIGAIAESFRELVATQRSLLKGLGELSASVQGTSEQIEEAGTKLSEMSDAAAHRIDGAQRSADSTRTTLNALTQRTVDLEVAMAGAQTASENVGSNAKIVASKVAEASRVGEQNHTAINEVSRRLKAAQQAADQLDDLVNAGHKTLEEMRASLARVRSNAQQAAHAGDQVSQHADEGERAMGRTLDDLESIRGATKAAASALGELVSRVDEVTDVVSVIDEVAAQTNLLSLNASIIASQAGEHGKAFSVVAQEIKALSARTQDHTQRISELVANVKRESGSARGAMSAGLETAEKGAERGRHTATAFASIALAAAESRDRLRSISTETDQQATLSAEVARAIGELSSSVAAFTAEQKAVLEATSRIGGYVEEVARTTLDVQRASAEQVTATRQIDASIGQVRTISRALDEAQRRQGQAQSELLSALSALSGFAREQRTIASSLSIGIGELKRRVVALRGTVQRYRV